ncbi:gp121.1 [Bacillus phage W.Ph.]|uniref:Gp121.1 n=1 Tax=Bacillus phage W.Ph. TaxID=764595 RepID=L7UXK9_9CAUD|nr:gp121.1 [Bacillus phage W.Ph.]AGC55704.1 gp121.1 [Bacillus phage W.Ph.]
MTVEITKEKREAFDKIIQKFVDKTGMTRKEAISYIIAQLQYDLKCKER